VKRTFWILILHVRSIRRYTLCFYWLHWLCFCTHKKVSAPAGALFLLHIFWLGAFGAKVPLFTYGTSVRNVVVAQRCFDARAGHFSGWLGQFIPTVVWIFWNRRMNFRHQVSPFVVSDAIFTTDLTNML
jgi:hypothetical protein